MAGRSAMENKARLRILHFLAQGPSQPIAATRIGSILLDGGERGIVSVESRALESMAANGLVLRSGNGLALTEEGLAALRRAQATGDPFQTQHRKMENVDIEVDGAFTPLQVNTAESPLALLARRRCKDGRPFLSTEEFRSGERLRVDFTRGQLVPRIGANWEASVSSGSRSAGNGIADLADAALAARQRVGHALDAVGPELSGLLVDVCCFLKGLERVELERGWPVRSAKVVVKTALGALHRHYEPTGGGQKRRGSYVLHWGAADYRPHLAQK